MRNDARPMGHDDPPIPEPRDESRDDARESVTHDRQSHVINRGAEENAQRRDADIDPTMPTGDSTLRTNI